MGSLRRKTFTKPLPDGAELFERKGAMFARWQDSKGRKHTAATTTGLDGTLRIVVDSATWLGKYRCSDGTIVERSTGCRDKQAAAAVLAGWEQRVEKVRSGIISANEDAIADRRRELLAVALDAYQQHQRANGVSSRHLAESRGLIETVATECGFRTLADINRGSVEQWMNRREDAGTGARRRNIYLTQIRAFCRWCVADGRLLTDPLDGIARADQRSDRRKLRRPLTDDELARLLFVARWRPLAERGRETVSVESSKGRKRSNWTYAELTLDSITAACDRARERLRPDTVDDLLHEGRQRALIYATLVSTGLRRGELASVRMRDIHLDASPAFITLNAADEKNREGNTIILRNDLADDLRAWAEERSQKAADATLYAPTIRFDRKPESNTLPADAKLFDVPDRRCLLRIIDKDFALAGIPKVDERGRSVDIHCLRHSFATNLARAGVAPKVAQELLRHSDVNLTLSVYSHASAFDVAGALESLPALNTSGTLNPERPELRATGTLAEADSSLPPMLPPGTGHQGKILSLSGNSGSLGNSLSESRPDTKKAENQGKKRLIERVDNRVRTGDLRNHNPALSRHNTRNTNTLQPVPQPLPLRIPPQTHAGPQKSLPPDAAAEPSSDRPADFTQAVLAVMALPLTDAERAEAVRRLLASDNAPLTPMLSRPVALVDARDRACPAPRAVRVWEDPRPH